MLLVKKLHPDAIIPSRGTAYAAGLDLYAVEDTIIRRGQVTLVPTGIAIAFDADHYARIAPRSGLAVKHGLDVMAGVVDCDYRGEIKVALIKLGGDEVLTKVYKGDRIAQLIMERCSIMPVYEIGKLPDTARGANGWGSTGV